MPVTWVVAVVGVDEERCGPTGARRFQLAMSGSVPLPLPDLDGPPGRIGRSVEQPDEFPKLTSV